MSIQEFIENLEALDFYLVVDKEQLILRGKKERGLKNLTS